MQTTRPDQAAMRSQMTFHDQHGRPWDCTIDNRKESRWAPVTPPIPKFAVPFAALMPPQHFVRPIIGQTGRLRVDYEAWLTDVRRTRKAYDEQLLDYAHQRYKGQMVTEAIKNPPPDLLAMIGQPPPPLDFIRAMRAGNKWALGLAAPGGGFYPMPPWAEPLVSWLLPVEQPVRLEDEAQAYPDVELDAAPGEEDDVSDEVRADRERYQDLEEQLDPQATGGTAVRVRPAGRPARRGAAPTGTEA